MKKFFETLRTAYYLGALSDGDRNSRRKAKRLAAKIQSKSHKINLSLA